MIDLDNFKFVNDTLGHQAGDELIIRVAELLAQRLRSTDVLARLGGDEFGVLLPRAGRGDAERVARSLLRAVGDEAIAVAGTDRRITASIGIAPFEDHEALTVEDILLNADLAMYEAKDGGRDGLARFDTEHSRARLGRGPALLP